MTRRAHPIARLPAVALALATSSLPAASRSGSEAVLCVASERRTPAANPIRRAYMEDVEVVYRTGVAIGQRKQVESNFGFLPTGRSR